MKQIIFTGILIFAICFTAFAQTDENTNISPKPTLRLLAEFNDSDNEWYKLTVEIIGIELLSNPSATGLIKIRNDENFARRLNRLRTGFIFRNMSLSRITFLIADKQTHDTEVFITPTCAEIPQCENCIVIRAIDIDRIEKLFKPKTITKKRKRK